MGLLISYKIRFDVDDVGVLQLYFFWLYICFKTIDCLNLLISNQQHKDQIFLLILVLEINDSEIRKI
ncbi:MAG: hypothetical protein CMK59_09485 [Proteobacteria bacterium]|nr:hypothetical protein [Pseudomonadota bacterium]